MRKLLDGCGLTLGFLVMAAFTACYEGSMCIFG